MTVRIYYPLWWNKFDNKPITRRTPPIIKIWGKNCINVVKIDPAKFHIVEPTAETSQDETLNVQSVETVVQTNNKRESKFIEIMFKN